MESQGILILGFHNLIEKHLISEAKQPNIARLTISKAWIDEKENNQSYT
jgi:hypothetical protein